MWNFYSRNSSTTTTTDGTTLTTIIASGKGSSHSSMCTGQKTGTAGSLAGWLAPSLPMLTWRMSIFSMAPTGRPREHKAEFLRDMAEDIILDKEWRQKKFETSRRSARLAAGETTPEAEDRSTMCALKKIQRGTKSGMPWARVSRWPPATNGTSDTSAPAHRKIIRHAGNVSEFFVHVSSPVTMLCSEHYAAHRAARWDT